MHRFILLSVAFLIACTSTGNPVASRPLELLIEDSETDCGTLVFDNSAGACADVAAALACFAAEHPHLAQQTETVEGAVILEHFFKEDGQIVHMRDTRLDQFGPQEVTRKTCAAVATSALGGCEILLCLDK
jgi:hypothetical protein